MYSTFLIASPGSVLFSRSNLLKRKDLCFSCLRLGLIRHRRSLRSSHLFSSGLTRFRRVTTREADKVLMGGWQLPRWGQLRVGTVPHHFRTLHEGAREQRPQPIAAVSLAFWAYQPLQHCLRASQSWSQRQDWERTTRNRACNRLFRRKNWPDACSYRKFRRQKARRQPAREDFEKKVWVFLFLRCLISPSLWEAKMLSF